MKIDAIKIINHIMKQIHIKKLYTLCNETHLLKHEILLFYEETATHIFKCTLKYISLYYSRSTKWTILR